MNGETRQRFETWMQTWGPTLARKEAEPDDYLNLVTQWCWNSYQAGSDAMKERAAQAINDYFDKWMSCDCQPDKGTAKYNTKSGHATNCILDDQFRLLAELQALE